MPSPISLPPSPHPVSVLDIPTTHDPMTILTAVPFLPDPDQAWAMANQSKTQNKRAEAGDLKWEVRGAFSESLNGMTADTGSWRGGRAEGERSYGHNLDRAFITSGLALRLSARLPVGPDTEIWQKEIDNLESGSVAEQRAYRAIDAYLHARNRAEYKIGQGLLDAATALIPSGLLAEAKLLNGEGRNRAERLLIRDAIFASEDLTIEEMARILVYAPYHLDEIIGNDIPAWERDRVATERTPLIFVHCVGMRLSYSGHREVVLEAVDFQSIEVLDKCLSVMRERDYGMHRDVQDLLMSIHDDPPISSSSRRHKKR